MGKDYVFATARVRSVEKNLLTREKVEKMVDSKTPADALKVLYDSDYDNHRDTGTAGKALYPERWREQIRKSSSFPP